MNDGQSEAVAMVRGQLWDFYAELKAYRLNPDARRIPDLERRFTKIFSQRTGYATLNGILKRIHAHKQEMLLVLYRPEVPLHTNASETDIRDYVKNEKSAAAPAATSVARTGTPSQASRKPAESSRFPSGITSTIVFA